MLDEELRGPPSPRLARELVRKERSLGKALTGAGAAAGRGAISGFFTPILTSTLGGSAHPRLQEKSE